MADIPAEHKEEKTLGEVIRHIAFLALVPGSGIKVVSDNLAELEKITGEKVPDRFKTEEYIAFGFMEFLRTGATIGLAYFVSEYFHLYEIFPGM